MFRFSFLSLVFFSISSFCLYYSFRTSLLFDKTNYIIYTIFQIIVFITFFYNKKNFLKLVNINLFFIIFINLLLTPIFFNTNFKIPKRLANQKNIIDYDKKPFFQESFSGVHTITTDIKGYRTNANINYKNKPLNVKRLITIGASTTEEDDTDDSRTWSFLLAKKLSKNTNKSIEMINMGMSGTRIEHHYFSLKKAAKYNPDIIIFLFGINDWNNHIINRDLNYKIPIYEINFSFKSSVLFKIINNIKKYLNKNDDYVKTKKIYEIKKVKNKKIVRFNPTEVSKNYSFYFNKIIKFCKSRKLNCFFADQPVAYNKSIQPILASKLWMNPPLKNYTLNIEDSVHISSMYNDWLKDRSSKLQLNFCPISKRVKPSSEYFLDDCHFTEKGSVLVANLLSDCFNLKLKFIIDSN